MTKNSTLNQLNVYTTWSDASRYAFQNAGASFCAGGGSVLHTSPRFTHTLNFGGNIGLEAGFESFAVNGANKQPVLGDTFVATLFGGPCLQYQAIAKSGIFSASLSFDLLGKYGHYSTPTSDSRIIDAGEHLAVGQRLKLGLQYTLKTGTIHWGPFAAWAPIVHQEYFSLDSGRNTLPMMAELEHMPPLLLGAFQLGMALLWGGASHIPTTPPPSSPQVPTPDTSAPPTPKDPVSPSVVHTDVCKNNQDPWAKKPTSPILMIADPKTKKAWTDLYVESGDPDQQPDKTKIARHYWTIRLESGETTSFPIEQSDGNRLIYQFPVGTHQVEYFAEDGCRAKSQKQNITVTVQSAPSTTIRKNNPPTAELNIPSLVFANPRTRQATVTLDASGSSDLDGDLLTYQWFINGQELKGEKRNKFEFSLSVSPKPYRVKVKVKDPKGLTDIAQKTLSVKEPSLLPKAVITGDTPPPPRICNYPEERPGRGSFNLYGITSEAFNGAKIDKYIWQDASGRDIHPRGVAPYALLGYFKEGSKVRLTVVDSKGRKNSTEVTLHVDQTNQPPRGDILVYATPQTALEVPEESSTVISGGKHHIIKAPLKKGEKLTVNFSGSMNDPDRLCSPSASSTEYYEWTIKGDSQSIPLDKSRFSLDIPVGEQREVTLRVKDQEAAFSKPELAIVEVKSSLDDCTFTKLNPDFRLSKEKRSWVVPFSKYDEKTCNEKTQIPVIGKIPIMNLVPTLLSKQICSLSTNYKLEVQVARPDRNKCQGGEGKIKKDDVITLIARPEEPTSGDIAIFYYKIGNGPEKTSLVYPQANQSGVLKLSMSIDHLLKEVFIKNNFQAGSELKIQVYVLPIQIVASQPSKTVLDKLVEIGAAVTADFKLDMVE